MQTLPQIHLAQLQAGYAAPEGRLWELLMGEQIHIGGFQSSMDLPQRAGIRAGQAGVDLCACTGAGMRFLQSLAEERKIIQGLAVARKASASICEPRSPKCG